MAKLQDVMGFNEKEIKSTEEREGDVTEQPCTLVSVADTKIFRQQNCIESISFNISLPSEAQENRQVPPPLVYVVWRASGLCMLDEYSINLAICF